MKALSIRQPFAGMIVLGMKKIENRTWRTDYRGELAIHASKTWHRAYGLPPPDDSGVPKILTERGCVIAIADLVDVITPEQAQREYPDQKKYIEDTWCWVIENVQKLASPVPCDGRLGLFEVEL